MNINWKKWTNTYVKALLCARVLILLGILFSIVYFGGMETIYKTNMQKITGLDQDIKAKTDDYNKRKEEAENLKKWEEELKGIKTVIVQLQTGESSRVEAITQSEIIRRLINGEGREIAPLPEPHNALELMNFKPLGDSIIDISAPDTPVVSGGQPAPNGQPPGTPAPDNPNSINRYDFEMRVKGTYPALVDLVNQLSLAKNLVVIDKVIVTKSQKEKEREPDSTEKPDYPVPTEMTVYFSLFIHDAPKKTP